MVKAKVNSTNVTPPSQMPPGTALAGRLWSRAHSVVLRDDRIKKPICGQALR